MVGGRAAPERDHGFDAVQDPCSLGQGTEPHISPREGEDQDHRGQDEEGARQDQRGPSRPDVSEKDRHFCGTGTGNQVRGCEEVKELLVAQPLPALYDLLAHHGDMRGGAAEGDQPKLQEQGSDLPEGAPCSPGTRFLGLFGPILGGAFRIDRVGHKCHMPQRRGVL
jgi:hypothetical protein